MESESSQGPQPNQVVVPTRRTFKEAFKELRNKSIKSFKSIKHRLKEFTEHDSPPASPVERTVFASMFFERLQTHVFHGAAKGDVNDVYDVHEEIGGCHASLRATVTVHIQ